MTKQDFDRIGELRILIPKEYRKVVEAHEQATNITIALTGMPRGGGGGSMIESAVIRADTHFEIYKMLNEELNILLKKLRKEAYEVLDKDDADIVVFWYANRMRMTDIAKLKNVTERHVYRRRNEAVEILTSKTS